MPENITDPIAPAPQSAGLSPLPAPPNFGALPIMVGNRPPEIPQEGLLTGGTTSLNTLSNSGRYPMFFRGIDNEESYAQGQTFGDKFINDSVKMVGLAATTFVDGTFGTVYGAFKAIADGKFSSFYDNEITRSMDDFNKNMENQFANYYTKKETSADWYSPDNLMTANFWLDKVFKNLGFAAGAYASGALWMKGIRTLGLFSEAASVGNAAKAAAAGEDAAAGLSGAKRMTALESAFSNVNKEFAGSLLNRTTAQRAVHSLVMTSGEAAIEALDGLNRFREEQINSFIQENGYKPEGEDLDKINSLSETVGNYRFALNTALLTATNYIQLPKILGSSYKAEKNLFNDLVQPTNRIVRAGEKEVEKGVYQAAKTTLLGRAGKVAGAVFSPSESFEEFAQFAIESGVENYGRKQQRGEDASIVDDLLFKGFEQAFTTKEGIESALIGGISGGIMETGGDFANKTSKTKKANTATAVSDFNKSYIGSVLQDQVKGYNAALKIQQERGEAIKEGNFFQSKELESDFIHAFLFPKVKWGRIDLITEELNEIRQRLATPEGYKQLIAEGKIPEGVEAQDVINNLAKVQESAKIMADTYQTLRVRYSGQLDTKGRRLYPDEVIDKMIYANFKIQDYDRRLPRVAANLINAGLDVAPALDEITNTGNVSKETIDKIAADIAKLNITDEEKQTLNEDFADSLKISKSRKNFIDEYNEIKKNPKKYEDDTTDSPLSDKTKKQETVEIETLTGVKNIKIGVPYRLGRVVEYSANGKEVYRAPELTVLGKNADGTIKIKDNNGIRDVSEKEFASYKLGESSVLAKNKTANFFHQHWNDIFEYNFGKAHGGKVKGRLEYDPETKQLSFVYLDAKGQIKEKIVDNSHFQAQQGFTEPRIKKTGQLKAATPEQQEAYREFLESKEMNDSIEARRAQFEQRRTIVKDLVDTAQARKKALEDKILDKKKQLKQVTKNLNDLQENQGKFKSRQERKVKAKTLIPDLMTGFRKLTSLKLNLEQEVKELEAELEELEMNITYYGDLLQNIEETSPNFVDFMEDINNEYKGLVELARHKSKMIAKFYDLIATTNETIAHYADFIQELLTKIETEYSPEVKEAFERYKASKSITLGDTVIIKDILEDYLLIADVEKEITLSETFLKNVEKDLEKNVDAIIKDIEELEEQARAMYPIVQDFAKRLDAYNKKKAEEQKLLEDKKLQEALFISQKQLAADAGIPSDESEYVAEKEDPKPNITRVAHTTYDPTNPKDYNKREQSFLSVVDTLEGRDDFKIVTITATNEKAAGLEGVTASALANYKPQAGEEPILFVYVKKNDEGWHYVNQKGEIIAKVGQPAPLNEVVYGMATTASDKSGYYKEGGRFSGENQEEYRKEWEKERANILAKTGVTPESFLVSRGIPSTEKDGKYSVTELLPAETPLSTEGLVTVSTTGSITMPSGENVNVPVGRTMFTFGSTLSWLNNRQLLPAEQTKMFELLKRFTKDANSKKKFSDKALIAYLQSMFYFSSPYDKKGEKKDVGRNQIYFEGGYWVLGNGEVKVPFLESSFDNPETSAIINAFLKGAYINVNTKFLADNKAYIEYTGFDDKGEPTLKEWTNYQEFLLSGEKPILTAPSKEFVSKYSWLPSVTEDIKPVDKETEIEEKEEAPKKKRGPAKKKEATPEAEALKEERMKGVTPISGNLIDSISRKTPKTPAKAKKVEEAQAEVVAVTPAQKKKIYNAALAEAEKEKGAPLTALEKIGLRAELKAQSNTAIEVADDDNSEFEQKLAAAKKAKAEGKKADKEAQNRIVTDTEVVIGNIEEEAKYITDRINVPVSTVKNLIDNLQGGYAWGQFRDGAIFLYEQAEIGTGYHEAFEAVWGLFTSLDEKKNLLAEFRGRGGKFTDRETGRELNTGEATDHQIKEALAEEFRDYVQFGDVPPKAKKNLIQRFFTALKNFIKNVLLGEVTTADQFFKRIDGGYYKNASIVDHNSLNLVENRNKIEGLSQAQTIAVVKGVSSRIFQEIFGENASIIDFENSAESIDEIFDKVYDKLEDFYEGETGILLAMVDEGRSKTEIQAIYKAWQNIREDWPNTVQLTKEYLRTFSLVTKTLDNSSSDIIDTEDEVETNKESEESEYGGKNAESYLRDVFTLDAKKNAPMAVRLLFATVIDSEFVNKELNIIEETSREIIAKRDNATAMEQMVKYAKLFNNTLAETLDQNTIQGKFNVIKKLANNHPNYVRLVERLGLKLPDTQVDANDWKLRIKLFTTLAKQRPTAFIYTINEEGDAFTMPANQATARKTIIQGWLDELKVKASKSGIISYDASKKGYRVNASSISSMNVKTQTEQVAFLNKLGIAFSKEMIKNLSTPQKTELGKAVKGLQLSLTNGKLIASTAQSLEASANFTTIADLTLKALGHEPESTFFNIEGKRIQEFVLPNFFSTVVNDLNEGEGLYQRLPHLQNTWHENSIYIKDGKSDTKFQIEYIQGTRDERDDFNPAKPTDKLNEAARLVQEINQNLRGSYYTLIPADSKTEWMLAMKQAITLESVSKNIGWANFYKIFENYFKTEQDLFKVDGKNRFLAEISDYNEELDTAELRKFVEQRVNDQIEFLKEYKQIREYYHDNEATYTLFGFDSEFLKKNKIDPASVTRQELVDLLTFRTMNYMINNVEMHKLFYGDPVAYGNVANMLKRYKSFLSPRETSVHSSPEVNNFLHREYNYAHGYKLRKGIPGFHEFKDHLKTTTLGDVEVTGFYEDTNTTDGQSWSTLSAYREFRMKAGFRWSDRDEQQYQYIQSIDRYFMHQDGLLDDKNYPKALQIADEDAYRRGDPHASEFNPLKPIGSGYSLENNPFLDKTSIVPLSYALTRETNLSTVYKKMLDESIDYLIVESGRKVGAQKIDRFYNEDGSINTEPYEGIVNVPYKFFGIQVETTGNSHAQVRGSQLTKLATVDLLEAGKANPKIKEKIDRNKELLEEMTKEGYDRMLDTLGIVDNGGNFIVADKEKLLNLITDELFRRELTANLRDALQMNEENTDFQVPLEALNNYAQIKNILYSYVDKYIASPKVEGGPKIQVSGALWESKGIRQVVTKNGKKVLVSAGLKFYENKDGLRHIEVLLPAWFARHLRDAGITWSSEKELMEKIQASPEAADILSGIGFRIPTQKLSSAEVFVVKGFLPESAGSTVVVPEEITTKAGSDFDVDKLNTYLKNIYVDKEGVVRAVPFFGYGQQAKDKLKSLIQTEFKTGKEVAKAMLDEYVDLSDVDLLYKKSLENEYFRSLNEILTLPENFDRLLSPNSAKELKAIRKTLVDTSEKEFGEGSVKSILNPLFMSKIRHNFIVGKGGVGIAAVNQTGHALAQMADIFINTDFIKKFKQVIKNRNMRDNIGDGKVNLPHNILNGKSSLSMQKDRAGRYISDKISQYIDGFVDIAKDAFISQIGATMDQVGMMLMLERLGVPSDMISFFVNQPIIREYRKALMTKEKDVFPGDILEDIQRQFAATGDPITEFKERDVAKLTKHFLNNIDNYYNKKGDISNAEQLFVLKEYMKYQALAGGVFQFTQGTNYDTANFSDSNLVFRKQLQEVRAIQEDVVSSVSSLMDNTFLKETKKAIVNAVDAVSSIFKFDHPTIRPYFRNTVARLSDNIRSTDDFLKAARKVESSFIDYLVQNATKINTRLYAFMVDESLSVVKQLSEMKENAKGSLKDNIILNELTGVVGNNPLDVKNIKLVNKAFDVITSNQYTESLEELRDNPHTAPLYGNLVRIAFMQSGISRSPISFTDIIPNEEFKKILFPAITALSDPTLLINFEKTDSFFRNSWRDDTIVPVQKDRMNDYGGFKDRFFSEKLVKIYENKGVERVPTMWKAHPASNNYHRKFVKVVMIDQSIPVGDRKEMAKNGDFSFRTIHLLRRVEHEDGTPATVPQGQRGDKYAIFTPVYAWGQGFQAQEYYTSVKMSVYNNHTFKPQVELTNVEIIKALNIQTPSGKVVFDAASLPAVTPRSQPIPNSTPSSTLKIISGGQTGVDRMGLDVAKALGLTTGGMAPKGYKTEKGNDLSLKNFGLTESVSSDYPFRTEQNVKDSDGTILFGDMNSAGSKQTISYLKKHKKPYISNPTAEEIREFTKGKGVVNIAGNRGSKLKQAQIDAFTATLTEGLKTPKAIVSTPSTPSVEKIPRLDMQPDNIAQLKAGTKNITNRKDFFKDGEYQLPDGTRVTITGMGQYKVSTKYGLSIQPVDPYGGAPALDADAYAKGEGFKDWKDFVKNNKFSSNFINGTQTRYLYKIKVAGGEQFFQLNENVSTEAPIKELDEHLLNFLKPFGVKSKEFDSLKERLKVDALGATDVLNKLIWYTKNRNVETIPEEVGHMATMLMGESHPDIKELLTEINNWSEFNDVKKIYGPVYKNEKQVKIEAAGKLIAKALVKNYKANGINKNVLDRVIDSLVKILSNVTDLFSAYNYSEKLADKIAANILAGNTEYIASLKPSTAKLDYKKALEGNELAQMIIDEYAGRLGFKLVGSLAIAGQGENIYRNEEDPIHDLDFTVEPLTENQRLQLGKSLEDANAVPVHSGWKHENYTTMAYYIPKPGYTVDVTKRSSNGWAKEVVVTDIYGKPVDPKDKYIAVDFFMYNKPSNERKVGFFSSASDIYSGKLGLAQAGKEERMFQRTKDQVDYVLHNPINRNLKSSDAFIYYQLDESVLPDSKITKNCD